MAGIQDRFLSAIWKEHFMKGATLVEVAGELGCSRPSLRRREEIFPIRVVSWLWDEERYILRPNLRRPPPPTSHTGTEDLLRAKFNLTEREIEVIGIFAAGVLRRQVRQELGISENTLKSHIRSVTRKVGARGMREAVEKATRIVKKEQARLAKEQENA